MEVSLVLVDEAGGEGGRREGKVGGKRGGAKFEDLEFDQQLMEQVVFDVWEG
jgi:hypothetical protein